MSLSCGCDLYDGPTVFREKMVKARKQHVCYECGKRIEIGEEYQYIFGVWDGDASSFHTCEPCADLRESLEGIGFCSTYGDLKSDHAEYLSEYVGTTHPNG